MDKETQTELRLARIKAYIHRSILDGKFNLGELPETLMTYGTMEPAAFMAEMERRMSEEGFEQRRKWFEVSAKATRSSEASAPRLVLARNEIEAQLTTGRPLNAKSVTVARAWPTPAAILQYLTAKRVPEDLLDELVYEAVHDAGDRYAPAPINEIGDEAGQDETLETLDRRASEINNEGMLAQLTALRAIMGPPALAERLAACLDELEPEEAKKVA